MAASVTRATSAPCPARSASSSMTSAWMRVESTSITTRRLARRWRPAGWTAMSNPPSGRLGHQLPPEPGGVAGAGEVELEAGDGVAGQPGDAVDVAAAAGDPGGHGGHGGGRSGWPRTVTCSRPQAGGPDRCLRLLVGAGGDLDVHAEVLGDLGDLGPDGGLVLAVAEADQHPEHEPAPDDDLLDVGDLDVGPGQGTEQGRGHAGAVPPGDGDEKRPVGGHRSSIVTRAGSGWWSGRRPAPTPAPAPARPRRKRRTATHRAVAPPMWMATSAAGTSVKYCEVADRPLAEEDGEQHAAPGLDVGRRPLLPGPPQRVEREGEEDPDGDGMDAGDVAHVERQPLDELAFVAAGVGAGAGDHRAEGEDHRRPDDEPGAVAGAARARRPGPGAGPSGQPGPVVEDDGVGDQDHRHHEVAHHQRRDRDRRGRRGRRGRSGRSRRGRGPRPATRGPAGRGGGEGRPARPR